MKNNNRQVTPGTVMTQFEKNHATAQRRNEIYLWKMRRGVFAPLREIKTEALLPGLSGQNLAITSLYSHQDNEI